MDGESDSFCVSTVLNFRVSYVGQSTEAALKLLSVLEVLEDLFKMSSFIMFIDDVQCLLVGLSLKKQHFNEFIWTRVSFLLFTNRNTFLNPTSAT